MIIIDLILCDIFVVIIIVDILDWTGSLIYDLHVYKRWGLGRTTVELSVMMELLTYLNSSMRVMLK